MILQVKKLDVEVLGWRGYTWSAVVTPFGHTTKFSKTTLEVACGREINILVEIPAVSMPIARWLKTWDVCGLVFIVAFHWPQHKVHLCDDHAV